MQVNYILWRLPLFFQFDQLTREYLKIENWIGFMLEALDKAAASCENSSQAARLLAAVADLLGCAAGNEAGLRSGPAYNKDWDPAFDLLEVFTFD